MSDYSTWYEFKKDLERETGRSLLNCDWLGVKPAAPLPWDESQFRSTLLKLERPRRLKTDRPFLISTN